MSQAEIADESVAACAPKPVAALSLATSTAWKNRPSWDVSPTIAIHGALTALALLVSAPNAPRLPASAASIAARAATSALTTIVELVPIDPVVKKPFGVSP